MHETRVIHLAWFIVVLLLFFYASINPTGGGQRVPDDRICTFWANGSQCVWKDYKECDPLKSMNCA